MAVQGHAGRERPLNVIQGRVQLASEAEGVGSRLFLDSENNRWGSLVRTTPAFQLFSDVNLCDIPHQNGMSIPGFHNNVADFLLVRCAFEPLNDVLLPARYAKSGRGVVVGAAERVLDLAERDIVLSEFNRINQNLILLLTAPGGYDLRDAGNGEQAPAMVRTPAPSTTNSALSDDVDRDQAESRTKT
jgi:hypothetical protein